MTSSRLDDLLAMCNNPDVDQSEAELQGRFMVAFEECLQDDNSWSILESGGFCESFDHHRLPTAIQHILSASGSSKSVRDKAVAVLLMATAKQDLGLLQRIVDLLQCPASTDPSNGLLDMDNPIVKATETCVFPNLDTLFKNHPMIASQLLHCIIRLTGKPLIRHLNLLNRFMLFIELCFKHSDNNVVQQGFEMWRTIIVGFSDSQKSLSASSHLNVLMKPMLYVPCSDHSLAWAKLLTWWTLVVNLGEHLESRFSVTCVPLMHFCAGGTLTVISSIDQLPKLAVQCKQTADDTLAIEEVPNLTVVSTQQAADFGPAQLPVIERVRQLIPEVAARILLSSSQSVFPNGCLEPLCQSPLKKSAQLVELAPTLVDFLCSSVNAVSMDEQRLSTFESCFAAILKPMVQRFCSSCQDDLVATLDYVIVSIVNFLNKSNWTLVSRLKLFVILLDIVNSTRQQSAASSTDVDNQWTGFVENQLHQLLGKYLRRTCKANAAFVQSRLAVFYTSVHDTLCAHCANLMMKFWYESTAAFVAFLQETSQIDDENKLECHPASSYTLLSSVFLYFDHLPNPTEMRHFLVAWEKLYKESIRCVELLASFTVNEFLVQLVEHIYDVLGKLQCQRHAHGICCLMRTLAIIEQHTPLTSLDQSALSPRSPEKFTTFERLPNVMIILLQSLNRTADVYLRMVKANNYSFSNSDAMLVLHASNIIQQALLETRNPCHVVCILQISCHSLADLIETTEKLDNNVWQNKMSQLEKNVELILKRVVDVYFGPFDSNFLSHLAPLLTVILKHRRRTIRLLGCNFWQKTFSSSSSIFYPPKLLPILTSLCQSGTISAPSLHLQGVVGSVLPDSMDGASNVSRSNSMIADPVIVGQPSPQKMFGSVLQSVSAQKQTVSPFKEDKGDRQFSHTRKRLWPSSPES